MKKLISATIALASLLFSHVYAADLLNPPPSIFTPSIGDDTPQPRWAGSYIGVSLGFSQLDGLFTDSCFCEARADSSSKQVGAFFGHNWQLTNREWIGIEGDINYNANEIHLAGADVGADLSGSLRLRIGEVIGNTLVYAALGWTAANLYVQNPDDSAVAQGWTLGAGVDWAINDTTFVRAEYRFNNYSPATLSGVEVDFDQDVLRVGIAHKF